MQDINFAIIAKFRPYDSSASGEAFQLPNNSIKKTPPPPPPRPFFIFCSHSLSSLPPCAHKPSPAPLLLCYRALLPLLADRSRVPPIHCASPSRAPAYSSHHLHTSLPVTALRSCVSDTPLRTGVHRRREHPKAAPYTTIPYRSCSAPASSAMVRTRGAHRYRPKVQFSTPERDGAGTSKAAAGHSLAQVTETPPTLAPATAMIQGPTPASFSEEAQASEPPSRRYQTRVGPWPPSYVYPRPRRRALPSKRAWTSGQGESSRSRLESLPSQTDQISSPHLSPASRIRRPMFSCDPFPGNVNLRA